MLLEKLYFRTIARRVENRNLLIKLKVFYCRHLTWFNEVLKWIYDQKQHVKICFQVKFRDLDYQYANQINEFFALSKVPVLHLQFDSGFSVHKIAGLAKLNQL
jgi:hypothetical protein